MKPLGGSLARALAAALAIALLAQACGVRGATQAEFKALAPEQASAEHPFGLRLSADPTALGADVRVSLTAIAPDLFLNAPGPEWQAASAALPSALRPQSVVFGIETVGETPDAVAATLTLAADPPAGNHLDLYAWTEERWEFVPASLSGREITAELAAIPRALAAFETGPQVPFAASTLEPDQAVDPTGLQALNLLFATGLRAQVDGNFAGTIAGGPEAGHVIPVLRNYGPEGVDGAVLAAILQDRGVLGAHVRQIAEFALSKTYSGVALDYRGASMDQRDEFTFLAAELARALHDQGQLLAIFVEPPQREGALWDTGGYDWRALGAAADFLVVPAGEDPAVFADGRLESLFAWAVRQVSRHKLLLATSALSADSVEGDYSLIGYDRALGNFGQVEWTLPESPDGNQAVAPGQAVEFLLGGPVLALGWDEASGSEQIQYLDSDNRFHTVWLNGPGVLTRRFDLARRFHLGGVVLQDLFTPGGGPGAALALLAYRTNLIVSGEPAAAALLWSVTDTNGQVIQQAASVPGETFGFSAETAGRYLIGASYQGQTRADLGAVWIEVAQPIPVAGSRNPASEGGAPPPPSASSGGSTPAPTPPPAPTPVPPTPVPTAPPPAPPPPVASGSFEVGGQTLGGIPGDVMHSAHMKWVKNQARGGDMSGFIADAHGQGFKVQLTVLLDIGRVTDPGYWPEVAAYAAGQAAAGADAIEVWNEMNIDAEWPAGQINPATYVEMLKVVYPAIKAANPGTLVISGALAPTGAEAAFPGQVMNDDNYLYGMAAAGAANYMDCVGIHYNTGTTSPSATEGSALAGYHYSFYFWPMVDLYWGAFGGARQLCFTELGYLTGEGYGPLPANFAWAAGNTLAEQAAWLAEAASLGGNSGKVRLMIIWNVNSTTWTHDPQAGYAIIRPDGSCPACGALAGVVP